MGSTSSNSAADALSLAATPSAVVVDDEAALAPPPLPPRPAPRARPVSPPSSSSSSSSASAQQRPRQQQQGFVVPARPSGGVRRKGKRTPMDATLTADERLALALAEQGLTAEARTQQEQQQQPGSLVDMANRMHLQQREQQQQPLSHRVKPRAPSSAPSSQPRRSESDAHSSALSHVSSSTGGSSSSASSRSAASSTSPASSYSLEPVSLRDFDVLKLLGKGSHGKVYLVRHKASKSLFALKELRKSEVLRKKQEANTRRELQVNALLQQQEQEQGCPYVVPLRFAFHSRSRLYLVFDFLSGGELYTHLTIRGRLPEELARFYAAEMALALDALHGRGVIYRDLKPENLLLDAEGHIHLADLGLCQDGIESATSGSTTFAGTREYLAPEILTYKEHGFAVDFWALGMVVYELLTGLPPFYSYDQQEVVHGILNGTLEFPDYVAPDAQSLVRGLLQRDPSQRLGSRAGLAELAAHPWLRGIDWNALARRKVPPPFRPPDDDPVCNFDPEFTAQPLDAEPDYVAPRSDDVFSGFYYDPRDPAADGGAALLLQRQQLERVAERLQRTESPDPLSA